MPDSTVKPRRSVAKRWMLALAVLVAGLLLLELGARAVMWMRGKPYSAAETAEKLRHLLSPIQAFVPGANTETPVGGMRRPILHPFYGGEEVHDTGGVLAHFRERARPDDFEIVLIGGSVAAFLGLTDAGYIEQAVGADPRLAGRHVVLLNAAHAAYKQPQQLHRITLLLTLGYVPDVVVLVDGFNEVSGPLDNADHGTHPVWPSTPIWGGSMALLSRSPKRMETWFELWGIRQDAYDTVSTSLDLGLQRSAVLGTLALSRLHALGRRRASLQSLADDTTDFDPRAQRQIGGPDFERGADQVLDVAVRAWAESSRSLRDLCTGRGIHYLHVLQPTLLDVGSKPLSPEELAIEVANKNWPLAAGEGYQRLRAAGQRLAAEGEHFVDASRAFAEVTETLYFDGCHFGPKGNQILSEIIVRHLLEDVLPH